MWCPRHASHLVFPLTHDLRFTCSAASSPPLLSLFPVFWEPFPRLRHSSLPPPPRSLLPSLYPTLRSVSLHSELSLLLRRHFTVFFFLCVCLVRPLSALPPPLHPLASFFFFDLCVAAADLRLILPRPLRRAPLSGTALTVLCTWCASPLLERSLLSYFFFLVPSSSQARDSSFLPLPAPRPPPHTQAQRTRIDSQAWKLTRPLTYCPQSLLG